MPCYHMKLPNGGSAIVRMPAPRARRCRVCQRKTTDFALCDYVTRPAHRDEQKRRDVPDKTCSAVLCRACAIHLDPDTDYCPLHAAALGVDGRRLRL